MRLPRAVLSDAASRGVFPDEGRFVSSLLPREGIRGQQAGGGQRRQGRLPLCAADMQGQRAPRTERGERGALARISRAGSRGWTGGKRAGRADLLVHLTVGFPVNSLRLPYRSEDMGR